MKSNPIVISAVAQKGGVGKTTSVYSLGKIAASHGVKTVLIDFDSQASLSTSLIDMDSIPENVDSYSFVKSNADFTPVEVSENLHLIPASLDLLKLDKEDFESYYTLDERIKSQLSDYDLVVIDTAGTLRTTLTAALVASQYFYSPIELNSYSIKSYGAVADLYKNAKRRLNADLTFIGFLPNRIHGTREIDGETVPNQIDERKVYSEITGSDSAKKNIIYLLEELAGIRRSVQSNVDISSNDAEIARKHLEAASLEIFKRIGLELH